jgi:hypothetical protein
MLFAWWHVYLIISGMQKNICFTFALYFCFLLAYSQNNSGNLSDKRQGNPPDIIDTLTINLLNGFADIKGTVAWKKTSFGREANFLLGYEMHKALYDNNNQYKETLKKSSWPEISNPTLNIGFETSLYGLLPVLTFWKNISLVNGDYYFELLGTDGVTKEVWADSNGNFFESPLFK